MMDLTNLIDFQDVEYIDIRFKLTFDVNKSTPADFSGQVDSYLAATYALGQLDFGASVDHSKVVYQITNAFSSYIKRFELVLQVIEEADNVTIPTAHLLTRTLLLGSLRPAAPNVFSTLINIYYKKGTGASYSEAYKDNGSGTYVKVDASAPDSIISSSIDYTTGLISLTLNSAVTSISHIEYIYETYDIEGIIQNVDIKPHQIVEYNSSQSTIVYV
jgi:hypothetical protein